MLTALWNAWNRVVNALNQFADTLEQATAKLDGQAARVNKALPDAGAKALPEINGHGKRSAKAKAKA